MGNKFMDISPRKCLVHLHRKEGKNIDMVSHVSTQKIHDK